METQTAPSFERTDSNVVFLPGHTPDTSASSPADSAPDSDRTTIGRTYTFKQAAELLACNESTLRRRYWEEKIEPAFRHCPKPLQTIAKYDTKGKPVYRLNEVAIEVFQAFLAAKAEGNEDAFLLAAREQYPASAVSPEPPAIRPDVLPPADVDRVDLVQAQLTSAQLQAQIFPSLSACSTTCRIRRSKKLLTLRSSKAASCSSFCFKSSSMYVATLALSVGTSNTIISLSYCLLHAKR